MPLRHQFPQQASAQCLRITRHSNGARWSAKPSDRVSRRLLPDGPVHPKCPQPHPGYHLLASRNSFGRNILSLKQVRSLPGHQAPGSWMGRLLIWFPKSLLGMADSLRQASPVALTSFSAPGSCVRLKAYQIAVPRISMMLVQLYGHPRHTWR